MKKLTLLVALGAYAAFIDGCATSSNVEFTSNPSGATATVETRRPADCISTTTPGTVKLAKGKAYFATYALDGYHTVTVPVVEGAGKAVATTAGASALMLGMIAPDVAGAWSAAAFVGGTMPAVVVLAAVLPVAICVYAIGNAAPPLPEEVFVEMVPVCEPPPENAGDMEHWRNRAAEERAKVAASRAQKADQARRPGSKGIRR